MKDKKAKKPKNDTMHVLADELEQAAIDIEAVILLGHLPFEAEKIRKIKDRLIVMIGGGGTGND